MPNDNNNEHLQYSMKLSKHFGWINSFIPTSLNEVLIQTRFYTRKTERVSNFPRLETGKARNQTGLLASELKFLTITLHIFFNLSRSKTKSQTGE